MKYSKCFSSKIIQIVDEDTVICKNGDVYSFNPLTDTWDKIYTHVSSTILTAKIDNSEFIQKHNTLSDMVFKLEKTQKNSLHFVLLLVCSLMLAVIILFSKGGV